MFSIVAGRAVADGETAGNEVVLNIHYNQGTPDGYDDGDDNQSNSIALRLDNSLDPTVP